MDQAKKREISTAVICRMSGKQWNFGPRADDVWSNDLDVDAGLDAGMLNAERRDGGEQSRLASFFARFGRCEPNATCGEDGNKYADGDTGHARHLHVKANA